MRSNITQASARIKYYGFPGAMAGCKRHVREAAQLICHDMVHQVGPHLYSAFALLAISPEW
jgi:hypothetical protein